MSLDRSLKSANALIRHRNVLTRTERLVKLNEEERWNDSKSVFGLPKVAHRKQALAKAVKEETAEGAAGAARVLLRPRAPRRRRPRGLPRAARPARLLRQGGKAAAPAAKAAAPAAKKK